jgi:hypothetical protein
VSVNQYERRSYVILTIISICFLLSIIFMFNFPGMINDRSGSCRRLQDGGNYDIRLVRQQRVQGDGKCREKIVDRLRRSEGDQMGGPPMRGISPGPSIYPGESARRLRANQEFGHQRIIDDNRLIEILQAELEQARRRLTQT